MPNFELDWTMTGGAVIEADDAQEAKVILREGMANLDVTMFESWDVTSVEVDRAEEE